MHLIKKQITKTVIDHTETGEMAKTERFRRKIALKEIAARMGYSGEYITMLEKGDRKWNENLVKKYKEALRAEVNITGARFQYYDQDSCLYDSLHFV